MDNLLGTLIYKITGDSTALDRDLDASRSKIDKTGSSIVQMGERIKRVSTTIISGYLIKSLLNASSRVAELQNKFDTVFAGIENDTSAWVRQYADATNRGITATKEFLATQQDLRTGYGDTIESAARYSQAVVGITNDLASFSNVPVTEAMASMQSGLSFQFEALRRLGVSLSVATINQGEYAASIGKTWEQMSNLEKQEAVLSGVVSQSKNALHQDIQLWKQYDYTIGDAARTSESFANSSQGAQQRLDDLKAELGDALIPTATAFLNVGLDVMKMFNEWPDAAQSATAAALAFGVAMTMVTGPVGVAIGSIAALTVLISSAKEPSERLASTTAQLSQATSEYNEITKQLSGNTDSMTQSERNLLEARKAILALEVQKNLQTLITGYSDTISEIEKYEKTTESAQAKQAAYSLAAGKGIKDVRAEIERLEKIPLKSKYDQAYYDNLVQAQRSFFTYQNSYMGIWERELEKAVKNLADQQGNLANAQLPLNEAVLAAAMAVNSEAVSVEYLALTYPELYEQIMTTAAAIKVNTVATDANSNSTKQAVFAATEWQTKLKELQADQAEEAGKFKQAAEIRVGLLKAEREEAIRKLAVDAHLIGSEEDVTTMSLDELTKRITANAGAWEELKALNSSYATQTASVNKNADEQIQKADKEKTDTLAENAKKITDMLLDQSVASKQAAATELEQNGKYDEAYAIRLLLIQTERDASIVAMQEKVDAGEATENELINIRTYYSNAELQLQLDKNKAVLEADKKKTDTLAENAKKISNMLLDQSVASRQAVATELEQSGKFQDANAIRLGLIEQERDVAITAMQEKVDAGEATQKELDDLGIYYANKQEQLQKEQADKVKDFWLDVVSTVASTITTINGNLSSFLSAQTDSQLAAIDEQTQSKLSALGLQEKTAIEKLQDEYAAAVKAGDMELAQEKSRAIEKQRIEDEADKKKQQLQIEQAKREKELNIFTATISMLSAIVKALADPGGWAGVGLSVAAGVTGALQIAAIQAAPLPSFAVGAENIPEDMLAVVHKGESILPAPMAESVRKGEATYGQGSNVMVTINNYSGAVVTQEERETDQGREYLISIGKAVDKQISEGRYDRSLGNRYGIRKVGIHG